MAVIPAAMVGLMIVRMQCCRTLVTPDLAAPPMIMPACMFGVHSVQVVVVLLPC